MKTQKALQLSDKDSCPERPKGLEGSLYISPLYLSWRLL
jgi:hypothetical protein